MDEKDILEAFTLDHPGFRSYPMVTDSDGGVLVHGDFHTKTADCRWVGEFKRRLFRDGSALVADHILLRVMNPFRQQRLALRHYAKSISFYDSVRIKYVTMLAASDGVVVWPQLGFEMREPEHKKLADEQFRLILAELGYEDEPPKRTATLALYPEVEGVKVGLRALAQTYRLLNERPIPMVLDLDDRETRTFLEHRGILRWKTRGQ